MDDGLLALLGLRPAVTAGLGAARAALLSLNPARRWSAHSDLHSPFFGRGSPMEALLANAPGGRGPVSFLQGRLDAFLLSWLQDDQACWTGMADALVQRPAKRSPKDAM